MTLSDDIQEQLLSFFKLLSNAQRLRIVGALAAAPLTAGQLARAVGMADSELQRHLTMLTDDGLVRVQSDGSFALDEHALERRARQVLAGQRQVAAAASEATDEVERKVLRDYLDGAGRLKRLPSQGKKLAIVLNYIARVFSAGVRYSEKEVNATLSRFHEDTAALRRSLVDAGLVARDHGVYWKVEQAQDSTSGPDN